MPESVEVVVMTGPIDNREVTDFSDPEHLIDQAYRLAERSLDDADVAQEQAPHPASPLVAPHRLAKI